MRLLLVVLALLPVGCASTKSLGPGATVEDQLRAVSRESGTFGDLVYVGTVAVLKEPTKPVYEYERRVKDGSSTSFTKQGAEPVLIEQATHDADYGLSSYVQWQLQTREVGRVTVENGVVRLSQSSGGVERFAEEPLRESVVVGPTLFGFIARHREQLLKGEVLTIRFAVTSRLETIPFELSRVDGPNGETRIRMAAKSALVALVVDPLFVTYSAEGSLVALDGRVPTKLKQGDGWTDFDAHVDYRNEGAFR